MGLLALNLPVIGQGSATEDQKVRDGLASIQTLLNGNVDEANVTNLAAAFTTWKNTGFMASGSAAAQGAATFVVPGGSTPSGASIALPASNGTAVFTFTLDPADWAANARTTKMRIRWSIITAAVAPAITFTPGLYPATSGAPPAPAIANLALGTVVAGSTVTFTTPALGTTTTSLSSEFNAPAAGLYAFGVALSGNMAANSVIALIGHLQYRQV